MKYSLEESNLECPNCGSKKIKHQYGVYFECEYCKEFFQANVTSLNKEGSKEMVDYLQRDLTGLYSIRGEEECQLRELIKKRNANGIEVFGWLVLIVSVVLAAGLYTYFFPSLFIFPIVGIMSFIISRIIKRRRYNKYCHQVEELAQKISDLTDKITDLSHFVSLIQENIYGPI